MSMRHTLLGMVVALLFVSGIGCEKSSSGRPTAALAPTKLSPDTVLRVYWHGKNDLGITASAYYFMRIWGLPQSGRVEIQTLAKLSRAPWRWLPGETEATVASNSFRLFPLLAGVLWNQAYFEIRQPAHQPAEYVLALHLDAAHRQLWQTNLAAVALSLTGIRPAPAPDGQFGWSLEKHEPPVRIALTRAGQWTLVSAGPDKNPLLDEIAARIRREGTPCVVQTPGDWLEVDANLPRLKALLPRHWNLPPGLPRLSLAVTGDGSHVLTHADLTFPRPLPVELRPWTAPTNLIHPPLMSFTAARGMKPWLASWKPWRDLQIGPPPNQIYSWSLPAGTFQTYFAAPLPDAAGEVRALSEHLLQKANPWLAAHNYLGFEPLPNAHGVMWGKSPSIRPFIQSAAAGAAGGVAYGGLIPESGPGTATNLYYYRPSFPELLDDLSARTNLVYYHWELTGARIQSTLYIGQFLSVISRHKPLPLDSAAAVWLKTVMPRLGNATTTVTRTGPDQLVFSRRSTVGFTAAELNLLATWLESPQFPKW